MNRSGLCWVFCSGNHFLDNNHSIKNILKTLKALDPASFSGKDNIDVAQLLKLAESINTSKKLEDFVSLYSKGTLYAVKDGIVHNKESDIKGFQPSTNSLVSALTKIISTSTPNLYIKKLFDFASKNGDKIVIVSKSPSLRLLSFLWPYSDITIIAHSLKDLPECAEKANLVILPGSITSELTSELKQIFKEVDIVNLADKFPSRISSVTPLPRLDKVRSSISDSFILFDKPLVIVGKIAKGNSRGSDWLGLPTANIISEGDYSYCVPGVYFGYIQLVDIGKRLYFTSTSIGYNIHFNDPIISIESYIHHTFDISLVGLSIRLELKGYIRSECSFDSLESLIETIQNDCNLGNLIDSTFLQTVRDGTC